jgi:iron(II)-dependent oxidoreductase
MGTTFAEVAQAVNQCTIEEQGNCTVEMAQDSMPVHTVKLSPYQMQRSEVTTSQYVAFLNMMGPGSHLNGCEGNPCAVTRVEDENSLIGYDGKVYTDLGGQLPMYKVTWYGAKAFCEASGGRLPTEAEWEYAARDGDTRIYPWGNVWDPLNARTSIPATTEVGPLVINSYPSGVSPFGLFDMAGNVAEWVSDWYDPNFYNTPEASQPNPTGPVAGTDKVVRGGSWDAKPFFSRSVHRQSWPIAQFSTWIGFRCAADAPAVIPTLTTTLVNSAASPATSTTSTAPAGTPLNTPILATPTATVPNTQPTLTATASG